MLRRPLGMTNLSPSVVGLGTVKIGRNQHVKYAEPYCLPSDHEVEKLLDEMRSLGINLIDTAPAYGTAEERLGRLLGSRRSEFIIVTKAGEEFLDGNSVYDFSSEHVERSVTRSLKRLKTDRIECVLVHCHRNDLEILNETPALETLDKIKMRGDILSYGASINSVEGGLQAAKLGDVVMVAHNLNYVSEQSVIEFAAKLQKGVLIKKGLQSGYLVADRNEEKLRNNLTHILCTPGVTSLLIGTVNPIHLMRDTSLALEALHCSNGRAPEKSWD